MLRSLLWRLGRELSLDGLFHNFQRVLGFLLVRPSACREEWSAAASSANCPGGAGNNLACVDSCLDRLVTGRNHDLDPVRGFDDSRDHFLVGFFESVRDI